MADPIHGLIRLNRNDPNHNLLLKVINSYAFQRLRRVRQMGLAEFVFPGATHTRFMHSIGTLWLTIQALEILKLQPEAEKLIKAKVGNTQITAESAVLVAALVHDIGHPPLSHTLEYVLDLEQTATLHDVFWNQRILEEDPELQALWQQYAPEMPKAIKQLMGGDKNYAKHFLADLVSSQLDMDRLDYLVRDSHYLGVQYGRIETEHLLNNLVLDEKPNGEKVLAVREETLPALEHYLFGRFQAYKMAAHHLDKASEMLLKKTFCRFRDIALEEEMGALSQNEKRFYALMNDPQNLSVEDYLRMDDASLWEAVKYWAETSKDKWLKILSQRLLRHDLFKVIDLAAVADKVNLGELFQKLAEDAVNRDLDPEYCFAYETIHARTMYYAEKRKIWIKLRHGEVLPFEDVSPLAHTPKTSDRHLLFLWDQQAKETAKKELAKIGWQG